jgi:hypothetical protein
VNLPAKTFILYVSFVELGDNNSEIYEIIIVTQFVVLCYGNLRKLICHPICLFLECVVLFHVIRFCSRHYLDLKCLTPPFSIGCYSTTQQKLRETSLYSYRPGLSSVLYKEICLHLCSSKGIRYCF